MSSGRVLAAVSAAISIAALVIALTQFEGIMTVTSIFALAFGIVASKRCSANTNEFILIAAMATLICTVLSVTVLSQEMVVDAGVMEEIYWFVLVGIAHVIPLIPLVLSSFVIISSVSNASYNWAIVMGLGPFIAMGMQVPGYVAEYIFQDINLDVWMVNNGYILYGLFVTMVVTFAATWLIGRHMRKAKVIIDENGVVPLVPVEGSTDERPGLDSVQDLHERRVSWALLVCSPVALMAICAFVLSGLAPGLDAGHPMEYLVATCVLWAIISMVLPILRIAGLVALPKVLLAVIYANIFFYVICLVCGLYLNVSWCGDLGHVVSSTIVSSIVFVALCLIQAHSPGHVTFGTRAGVAAMLFLVALSFGGIWEMMEGFTDSATGHAYMVYGATDTMGDLTADFIGVLIVTFGAYVYLNDHTMEDMASKVRFGRKAFEMDETH